MLPKKFSACRFKRKKTKSYTNSNKIKWGWTVKNSTSLSTGTVLRFCRILADGTRFTKYVRLCSRVAKPRNGWSWEVFDFDINGWVGTGNHTGPEGLANRLLENGGHTEKETRAYDAFQVIRAGALGQTLTEVRRFAARAAGLISINDM